MSAFALTLGNLAFKAKATCFLFVRVFALGVTGSFLFPGQPLLQRLDRDHAFSGYEKVNSYQLSIKGWRNRSHVQLEFAWIHPIPVRCRHPGHAFFRENPVRATRLYAYSSVGDNQWVSDWPPIDSPATVEALFEWLAETYHVRRMYWRGEQDRMWFQHYHFRPEIPRYYDFWTNYSSGTAQVGRR